MTLILVFAFLVFLVLLAAYLAVEFLPSNHFGGEAQARNLSEKISTISGHVWGFGRPIIQLVVIIAILGVILRQFNLDIRTLIASSDVRAVLAVGVVLAFCLAALGGSEGASLLKDVALVVVGFYFGTLDPQTLPRTIDTQQNQAPQRQAPQSQAPQGQNPQGQAPQTQTPQTSQPREQASVTETVYGTLASAPIYRESQATRFAPDLQSTACTTAEVLVACTYREEFRASYNALVEAANTRFHRTVGFATRR